MVDNYFLIGIITAVITIAGIAVTVYWNARLRKDKVVETRQTLQYDVEKTAREKFREEQTLAQQLAQQNKETASEVKQDMKDHIDRLIVILKGDIELQRVNAYYKMDQIDNRVAQIKIDLMDHIQDERDEHTRIQKSIDFLQTMNFGPEAKSIPGYMVDEENPNELGEAYKGVFASRKDTTNVKKDQELETKEEQDEKAKTESDPIPKEDQEK